MHKSRLIDRSSAMLRHTLSTAAASAHVLLASRQKRIKLEDEYFRKLSAAWSEALRSAFVKIEQFKL
jgi:predicted proteasome-type protease